MNKTGIRCRVCGTYLFNYDSKVLGLCKDHRPVLPPHMMDSWRLAVRNKLNSPTATQEEVKENDNG